MTSNPRIKPRKNPTPAESAKKFVRVFYTLLGLLGLFAVTVNGQQIIHSYRTSLWPHVTGIIVDSKVAQISGKSHAYELTLLYAYKVDGVSYQGTRIYADFYQPLARLPSDLPVYLYPIGKEMDVFYDPQNPKDAALRQGWSKEFHDYSLLIAGIVMLFLALTVRFLFINIDFSNAIRRKGI